MYVIESPKPTTTGLLRSTGGVAPGSATAVAVAVGLAPGEAEAPGRLAVCAPTWSQPADPRTAGDTSTPISTPATSRVAPDMYVRTATEYE